MSTTLHEEVIVPTALNGAEAWGMRSAKRRKVNILEMKCLRSLAGVSRMDRIRNGEVKVKSSMARSLPVENLQPQNVGSIINYLQ